MDTNELNRSSDSVDKPKLVPLTKERQPPTQNSCWFVSSYRFLLDLEVDPTMDPIFPPFSIFVLLLFVFWTRYILYSSSEAFSILHTKETQDIEVAHSEVYGYGFLPRELCTPSLERARDTKDGEGPWVPLPGLLPKIYMLIFRAKDRFGWSMTSFEAGRLFHGLVTATVPFSVYHFARAIFQRSRDVAMLAAVLVAFSNHVILLGLHPFGESLLSPVIFLTLAALVRIQEIRNLPNVDSVDVPIASGLLGVGFILAITAHINPDSSIMLALFLVAGPVRLRGLTTFLVVGTLLGMIFTMVSDPASYSTIRTEWPTCSDVDLRSLHLIASGNHVHTAILSLLVALVASLGLHHLKVPVGFFLRISDEHKRTVEITCSLGAVAMGSLVLHSVVRPKVELWHLHDTLIMTLVAGASAAHFFYRKLEAWLKIRPNLPTALGDVLDGALCCGILAYMWLGWSSVGVLGQARSADVNLCMRFVGQQPNVTGVILDFPLEMTGAYGLLDRDVPIVAKMDGHLVEWNFRITHNSTRYQCILCRMLRRCEVASVAMFDWHMDPDSTRQRDPLRVTYNYVITERESSIRGYYEVHRTGSFRVLQRSDDATVPTDPAILESEGGLLLLVGNYRAARDVLERALQRSPATFESWKPLLTACYFTGDPEAAHNILDQCRFHLGSECEL